MHCRSLKAVKILAKEGIKTNVTLVFSLPQALMAARAGATYVSPFIGRLDDIGENGVALVETWLRFSASTISIRRLLPPASAIWSMLKSYARRCGYCNYSYQGFKEMLLHPLTDKGLAQFLEDYKNSLK